MTYIILVRYGGERYVLDTPKVGRPPRLTEHKAEAREYTKDEAQTVAQRLHGMCYKATVIERAGAHEH